MGKERIELPREKIEDFCRKWKVREFALFGSVLQESFCPDSDIDVLVDFEPGLSRSLFDLVNMTDELKEIFGRDVDLLTRPAVEKSRNYIRRKAILSSMEVVYVS
jgi:predicted nucleotidyltransferase